MKSATTDLTKGSIIKALLLFTIPIMLGNILQQVYNIADTAIIGNILGDTALAAVGAAAPIYELVIGSSGGFANGLGVIVARNFGAKQEEELKKSIAWTYVLSLIIAILLSGVGVFGIRPLLELLGTPDNLIGYTTIYMRTIIGFYIITMLYNMFAAMLRAIGNSQAPLYFLGISTVLNVGLDLVFINVFHMGVAGAAYATGIAQMISVLCCITYIKKKCPILSFDGKYLKKDWKLVKELLTMGLSMALMFVVVTIGSVALQSSVNSLGDKVIAGHSSARRIDSVFMLPIGAFSSSCATFASQNYGAGKTERVKKVVNASILLCCIWSVITIVLTYLFGETWVKLLTGSTDTGVIDTAVQYIRINVLFFWALSVLIVIRSTLQGLGRKVVPLVSSTIELLAKFIAVGFVTPVLGYFGVCILEPVIWVLCAIVVTIDYLSFSRALKRKQQ